MFHVEISSEQEEYARQLVSQINFGNRGVADGNREQQVTGLIGQIALLDLFGLPRPDGKGGPDGGTDLVYADLTIDVKTMGRSVRPEPHHVNNFMGCQKHFATDILVFCSFNKRTGVLTLCGWIEKLEFLRIASFYPKGTVRRRSDGTTFRTKADLYEIENQELHSPNSPSALKRDLEQWAAMAALAEVDLAS